MADNAELKSAQLQIALLTQALNSKFERYVVMRAMDGTYSKHRSKRRQTEVFLAEPVAEGQAPTGRGLYLRDANAEEFELNVRGEMLGFVAPEMVADARERMAPSIAMTRQQRNVDVTIRINKLQLLEHIIETLKVGQ